MIRSFLSWHTSERTCTLRIVNFCKFCFSAPSSSFLLLFPPVFFQVIWCFFCCLYLRPHLIFFILRCFLAVLKLRPCSSQYSFTVIPFSSRNAIKRARCSSQLTRLIKQHHAFNGGIPQLIRHVHQLSLLFSRLFD